VSPGVNAYVDGVDLVLRNLAERETAAGEVMNEFIDATAHEIFDESQRIVPVGETEDLKDSGYVNAAGLDAEVGYGGPEVPYAVIVHEDLEYHHDPPRQAKFLEQPATHVMPRKLVEMSAALGKVM
jgi:hypothetical protein